MPNERQHLVPEASDREMAAEAESVARFYESGPSPPPLASKAHDLEALRTALVDAAGVGVSLWLSYLFALFYLLIAVGGVKHEDLFFEFPVRLPFLNVDLPLKGFFWLGPLLFLIVHAYVLVHFVLLSNKVRMFDRALRQQIPDQPDVRAALRRQLPSNIFIQFLAGPTEIRDGILGMTLWLIAIISLVIGPLFLLVFFALQFLPYHDAWVTWWQRLIVTVDLGLMWRFWPSIALIDVVPADHDGAAGQQTARRQRVLTRSIMWALSGGAAILLFLIATFPGEEIEIWTWQNTNFPLRSALASVRGRLITGVVNPATRQPTSLFSNRLVLPNVNVVVHAQIDNEAKLDFLPVTTSLRQRNLEDAVLIDAVLRKVDLTGANLRGALLDRADLRKAQLNCAEWLDHDRLREKQFVQRREPICTDLRDASLNGAQMQGASLIGAKMQDASLDSAHMQGAVLDNASMPRASLERALMQGASLRRADMRGASLEYAQMQGASLNGAQMLGASLNGADMRGASLEYALMQGASLRGADMRGASLDFAQMQGAFIGDANLRAASLQEVFTWRAESERSELTNARIAKLYTGQLVYCDGGGCPWTAREYQSVLEAANVFTGSSKHDFVMRTIKTTLDPDRPFADEAHMTALWEHYGKVKTPADAYEAGVAKNWRDVGCAPEGAPYVALKLIQRLDLTAPGIAASNHPFSKHSRYAAPLAASFLEGTCEGTRGLPEGAIVTLKRLRESGNPAFP